MSKLVDQQADMIKLITIFGTQRSRQANYLVMALNDVFLPSIRLEAYILEVTLQTRTDRIGSINPQKYIVLTMDHRLRWQGAVSLCVSIIISTRAAIFLRLRFMVLGGITGEGFFDHGRSIYHSFPRGIIPPCRVIHHGQ